MAKHDASASINEVSRISAGTEVQGNLISKSDIRIDGLFEGDMVTSGKLVLGDSAVIWGNVEGELCAKDTITFKSTASFSGNLKTNKICIEMGAAFSGNCRIITEDEFAAISAEYFKE